MPGFRVGRRFTRTPHRTEIAGPGDGKRPDNTEPSRLPAGPEDQMLSAPTSLTARGHYLGRFLHHPDGLRMALKERSCSTRVTAQRTPENTQPQAFRLQTLRSRNAPVTPRGLEEPQVVLVIASENFHRTRIMARFASRNVSNITTYVGVGDFPLEPALPRPIPPPFDGEMACPPATGLNRTVHTSKTIVK